MRELVEALEAVNTGRRMTPDEKDRWSDGVWRRAEAVSNLTPGIVV